MTDPDIMLEQVQITDLDAVWPYLEPDIAASCNAVLTSWTPASVKAAAQGGELALWAIYDKRHPTPVLGALTTGFRKIGDEMIVSFEHLGGRDMHRWLDHIVDQVETLSKQQGATIAEVVGRPGWARTMRKFGYEPAAITIRKTI